MLGDRRAIAIVLIAWSLMTTAEAEPSRIGTRPTEAEIAAWNIDVAPDGKSLPPGRGSVAQGRDVYDQKCAACHGKDLEGGMGPALVGGAGSLASATPLKTVGSYWPYATTLFDYIRRTMPLAAPQSLSNDEVYALTGYVLFRIGVLTEDAAVDAAVVVNVRMPNQDGFYVDDRPDAKSPACYQDCIRKPRS